MIEHCSWQSLYPMILFVINISVANQQLSLIIYSIMLLCIGNVCLFSFVLLCCSWTGTVKDKGCVFQYLVFILLGGKSCQITHPLVTIKLTHGALPDERDNLLQISFWNVNLRCYNTYLCDKTTYFPDSLQQHVTHTCWTSKDMEYIITSWHGYISISYLS